LTRRRRTILAAAALGVAVVAVVVGWRLVDEDDPYAAYCEEVGRHQEGIGEELASGAEATGLIDALPAFRLLQEEAPDDVRDEWSVVVARVEALEAAMRDADVDPGTYDRADPPDDVDAQERRRIDAAAAALVAPDSRAAFAGVAQHARDVCHTPLYL
jgi:hypothetical protein